MEDATEIVETLTQTIMQNKKKMIITIVYKEREMERTKFIKWLDRFLEEKEINNTVWTERNEIEKNKNRMDAQIG